MAGIERAILHPTTSSKSLCVRTPAPVLPVRAFLMGLGLWRGILWAMTDSTRFQTGSALAEPLWLYGRSALCFLPYERERGGPGHELTPLRAIKVRGLGRTEHGYASPKDPQAPQLAMEIGVRHFGPLLAFARGDPTPVRIANGDNPPKVFQCHRQGIQADAYAEISQGEARFGATLTPTDRWQLEAVIASVVQVLYPALPLEYLIQQLASVATAGAPVETAPTIAPEPAPMPGSATGGAEAPGGRPAAGGEGTPPAGDRKSVV